MNVERLERLADLLDSLMDGDDRDSRIGFNLSQWYCGTKACAVGHAALHPWFQQQGLSLTVQDTEEQSPFATRHWVPEYETLTGWIAVAKFFGIDYEEAESLFDPDWYERDDDKITPRNVAQAIRDFLSKKKSL